MKKYSFIVHIFCFLCCFTSIEAQNRYKVTSIDGRASLKVGGNDWEKIRSKTEYKLFDNDLIKVDDGQLKWRRNDEKTSHTLYQTPAISIISAWNLKPSDNITPMQGTFKQAGDRNSQVGDSVTIRFCFINSLGDWKRNSIIQANDTLVAMVINQSTTEELYAYAFWVLADGTPKPMSVFLEESICTIVPNYDNIFTFKTKQTITSNDIFSIYIFYSKEKRMMGGRWNNIEQVKKAMSENGFKDGHVNISIQQ